MVAGGGNKCSCPWALRVLFRSEVCMLDRPPFILDHWPWQLREGLIPILVCWTRLHASQPDSFWLLMSQGLLPWLAFVTPENPVWWSLRFVVFSLSIAHGSFRIPIKRLPLFSSFTHLPPTPTSFSFLPRLFPTTRPTLLHRSFSDKSKMQEHSRSSAPIIPVSWIHVFRGRKLGANLSDS